MTTNRGDRLYGRRFEHRSHIPKPTADSMPEVFINLATNSVYVYLAESEAANTVVLPGTARLSLDLDSEGNLVGLNLDDFDNFRGVIEMIDGLLRAMPSTVVISRMHDDTDEAAGDWPLDDSDCLNPH